MQRILREIYQKNKIDIVKGLNSFTVHFFIVEECKTRMESMRTMFRKILKKRREKGSDACLTTTEVDIERRCRFLEHHLRTPKGLRISLTPKKKKITTGKRKKVQKIREKIKLCKENPEANFVCSKKYL